MQGDGKAAGLQRRRLTSITKLMLRQSPDNGPFVVNGRWTEMTRYLRMYALAALLVAAVVAEPALAQKTGGILKMFSPDSPASMSILEEATVFAEGPMMGVFNNLVIFDQNVQQSSLSSIVPDLATGWSWNEDGTELTLPLRQGVEMARWPAVHGRRRSMHLGPADRLVE